MKKIYPLTFLIFFICIHSFAQKDPCKWVSMNNEPAFNKKVAKEIKRVMDEKKSLVDVGHQDGTYLRHVLLHKANAWEIDRDELGNILNRNQYVNFIYKDKNGDCRRAQIVVVEEYMGGGNYGALFATEGGITLDGAFGAGKVDCGCADKLTDWLGGGSTDVNSDNESPSNKTKIVSKTTTNPEYSASLTDYEKNKESGNGPYKEFSDGKIVREGNYKNGNETGLWKSYASDGSLSGRDYYTDGMRDSSFSYSDKVLRTVSRYKGRQKHGRQEEYYPNAKLQKLETYKNGVLEGKYGEYKEDGSVYLEGNYKEGSRQGKWLRENGSGDLTEGNYVDGEQDGDWTVKDRKTGKLIKTEKYEMGNLKK